MQQNTIHCTHNFSTFSTDSLHISHVENLFPHDNLSCGELLHLTICHVDKFLHMNKFSPWAPPVVPVTNMRYGLSGTLTFRSQVSVGSLGRSSSRAWQIQNLLFGAGNALLGMVLAFNKPIIFKSGFTPSSAN